MLGLCRACDVFRFCLIAGLEGQGRLYVDD